MSTNSHALIERESEALPINGKPRELLASAANALRKFWKAYWTHQVRRATVMLLQSLDDRALADIGFKRSEIESVVCETTSDRLRRYDPQWHERKGP